MAKTNDGNLLQHFVECQAAALLTESTPDLQLICTHAMAPFEAAASQAEDEFNRALRAVLAAPDAASPWPVSRAYARTQATLDHYPNTAELIAARSGDEHLSGTLCEKDEIHASVLMNRWAPTEVQVRKGGWRNALAHGHLEPAEPERPWLFTLDPHTWLLGSEANKAHRAARLCKADLELLRPLIGRFSQSDLPGALVVCVYGVDPAHAADFRGGVLKLADRLGLERTFLGVPARGGSGEGVSGGGGARHLAALLSPTAGVPAQVAEAWVRFRAHVGLS